MKEISATGGKAIGFAVDVTGRAEVEAPIRGAVESYGRIDVIVNNAGIMPIAAIDALKVNGIGRLMSISMEFYTGSPRSCLKCRNRRAVTSSISLPFGIKVFAPGATVYCATKAAVRTLIEGLRMELHSQNIRCTMISPGAVATELPESSSEEATRKHLREFYKMAMPANAIASAIAYAIEQPADVEIDEIVIRPTAQDF